MYVYNKANTKPGSTDPGPAFPTDAPSRNGEGAGVPFPLRSGVGKVPVQQLKLSPGEQKAAQDRTPRWQQILPRAAACPCHL